MYNEKVVPIAQLKKNIAKGSGKKQKVVLISTGAYCPAHKMHVLMFKMAKEQLEKNHEMTIVGCYLAPCFDPYIQWKLKSEFISGQHRAKMISLTIKNLGLQDYVWVNRTKLITEEYISHDQCINNLIQHLSSKFPDESIRVMYCLGRDTWEGFTGCPWLQHESKGVVVLYRNLGDDEEFLQKVECAKHTFVVKNDYEKYLDLSSSKIRFMFKKNEKIDEDLLCNDVQNYIKKHKLL